MAKIDVDVAEIKVALIGIVGSSGLVGDVKALTETVKDNATTAAESRALIHGRIDAVDRKATRATWWSKMPTVVLVAVGGLAGAWKQWLE